jgi:hypothetical protein
MAKISNKDIYQDIDSISLLDYLIGTKNQGKGTKSFPLTSIIQLINGTNGVNNIQFRYFDGTDPDVNYTTEGAFFTNTNSGNPANFTQIIFNKETIYPIDITLLFEKLGQTQDVVLTLKKPENPNNFIKLKVVSFTDNTNHFIFGVETYDDLFIGSFVNENIYSLYFDIIKSSSNDRFTSVGTTSLTSNNVLVSIGYAWVINGSNYANINPYSFTIPTTTLGNKRIDLFAVDRFNNVIRIPGVESVGNPVKPTVPQNTLELTFVLVDDNVIYDPTPPIVGQPFLEKEEKTQQIITGNGTVSYAVTNKKGRFLLAGTISQFSGFSSINTIDYYDGKKYSFKNNLTTNIILLHNSAVIPLMFSDNSNFTLKPNETIEFTLKTVNGLSLEHVGSIVSETDTLQSVTDRNNGTTNDIIVGYPYGGGTRTEISPFYYFLTSENSTNSLLMYTGESWDEGGNLGTHIDTLRLYENDDTIRNPLTLTATKVKLQSSVYGTKKFLVVNTHGVGVNVEEPTANLHSIGTVRHENITNAQGDSTFTKQVVAKADGTFGVEDKGNIPKQSITKIVSTGYYEIKIPFMGTNFSMKVKICRHRKGIDEYTISGYLNNPNGWGEAYVTKLSQSGAAETVKLTDNGTLGDFRIYIGDGTLNRGLATMFITELFLSGDSGVSSQVADLSTLQTAVTPTVTGIVKATF